MNLRVLAESDLGSILEDGTYGFAWDVTLTDPAGLISSGLKGFSNDISSVIDPDTGQVISGREASAVFRISTLYAQGFGLPRAVAERTSKPWVVQFDDINGLAYVFKVRMSNPDRALGIVSCLLEAYTQ